MIFTVQASRQDLFDARRKTRLRPQKETCLAAILIMIKRCLLFMIDMQKNVPASFVKKERKMSSINNIVVYLGADPGKDPKWTDGIRELGKWIGESGHNLVYGGSKAGLMGELAEAALQAGAYVTGVEPQMFIDIAVQHEGIQELIVTENMSQRKAKMIELGDAFIAFPGGTGTLEEISELISARVLGLVKCPVIIYNLDGYYDSLKALLENMMDKGFSDKERQSGITFAESLEEIRKIIGEGVNLNKVKNLLFDVGGVMLSYRWKEMLMDYGLNEADALRVGNEIFNEANHYWEEFDRGYMTEDELSAKYAAEFPEDAKVIDWFIHHGEYMPVPRPGVWDKVHELKGKYPMYVLSNYTRQLFQKHTQYTDFMKDMDGQVVSYEVHQIKPEPAIYQSICDKYDLKAEQCLFFDDRLANVQAARDFGMQAVHVQTEQELMHYLKKL